MKMKGNVYTTVVRPAMLYGADTWSTTRGKEARLEVIIIIIIYTTDIAPYIWPVWPFIGAEEGPSKY